MTINKKKSPVCSCLFFYLTKCKIPLKNQHLNIDLNNFFDSVIFEIKKKCFVSQILAPIKNVKQVLIEPVHEISNNVVCATSKASDLFVCFVALRPKSTAMVMVGRSVHLSTLFPGQA